MSDLFQMQSSLVGLVNDKRFVQVMKRLKSEDRHIAGQIWAQLLTHANIGGVILVFCHLFECHVIVKSQCASEQVQLAQISGRWEGLIL